MKRRAVAVVVLLKCHPHMLEARREVKENGEGLFF
jgi:hypothetical protein